MAHNLRLVPFGASLHYMVPRSMKPLPVDGHAKSEYFPGIRVWLAQIYMPFIKLVANLIGLKQQSLVAD